jgi:ribosomal protein S18 acetylase RimI-like enzyme
MFVVKDDETNKVVGCVGVEVQKFVGNVPLRRAENDLGDVEILDRPVIANLAVASSARRKGLAKSLMREIEEEVKKWGYDETILVVESANKKAVSLYKKSGYKPIFNDKAAPNLAIDENGKVVEAKVKAVTMRKSLKEGAQGALENLDLVKVLGGFVLAGLIAYTATNEVDGLPY